MLHKTVFSREISDGHSPKHVSRPGAGVSRPGAGSSRPGAGVSRPGADHTAVLNLEVTIAARVEIWNCAILVVKHTCTLIELNFTSELNTIPEHSPAPRAFPPHIRYEQR